MSAERLIMFAIASRITAPATTGNGNSARRFLAGPAPVTRPTRAHTAWIPIISGSASRTVQRMP
jgi:hypothetical protein